MLSSKYLVSMIVSHITSWVIAGREQHICCSMELLSRHLLRIIED